MGPVGLVVSELVWGYHPAQWHSGHSNPTLTRETGHASKNNPSITSDHSFTILHPPKRLYSFIPSFIAVPSLLACRVECCTNPPLFLLFVVQGVAGYNKFHLLILIGPDVFFCSQDACWAWFCSVSLCSRPRTLGRRWDEIKKKKKTHSGCKSFAGGVGEKKNWK